MFYPRMVERWDSAIKIAPFRRVFKRLPSPTAPQPSVEPIAGAAEFEEFFLV